MSTNKSKKFRKEIRTQAAIIAGKDLISDARKIVSQKKVLFWVSLFEGIIIVTGMIFIFIEKVIK